MKYKEFKKALDQYFNEDDDIYPHAGGRVVMFCNIYHGQQSFMIDINNGNYEFIECKPKTNHQKEIESWMQQ